MTVVLDTNVLVAAFVSDGLCRRLLLRARDRSFTLVISPFIRDEFARVLSRKAGANTGEIREALALIDEISTSVNSGAGETGLTGTCRDPDDDSVLACAVATGADYLVSGDKDLLVLDTCKGVKIIAPGPSSCFSRTDAGPWNAGPGARYLKIRTLRTSRSGRCRRSWRSTPGTATPRCFSGSCPKRRRSRRSIG